METNKDPTQHSPPIQPSPPVDSPPVDSPPVDSPPVDSPPVDSPPVDSPPVDSPPQRPSSPGPPSQPKAAGTKPRRHSKRAPVTEDQIKEIVRLHKMGFGARRIGKKVGLGRKVIRRILGELDLLDKSSSPAPSTADRSASKLDPFREQIKEKVRKDLTVTRILRELNADGYSGGRTILASYIRSIRTRPVPKKKVWRRFETRPAQETQFDWSPYRVSLAGVMRTVHAFAATLGSCRKTHVRFYRDERQSTLLEAHCHAFADFEGVTHRGVYDWMSTVVLGTVGADRKPLWHPRFVDFCRYYGYEPYLCKVGDPDRKGKDERIFWFLERDFLRGSQFDSLDDLNKKVRLWLDEVANCRVHGTTKRIPDEAWQQERAFLIPLPESRYPTCDEELRKVGPDAVISVRGTPYSIPAKLAHHNVSVRLYAEHFEVVDDRGEVVFSRRDVPEQDKGRLVIDSAHYDGVRPRGPVPGGSVTQLEDALLVRFPTLAALCAGIKLRMKGLCHIHLRALWRLANAYGDDAFVEAASRAQAYRRFDALAVRRILERSSPLLDTQEPHSPLTAAARALVQLGDVDGGSLDDYAELDTQSATNPAGDGDGDGDDHAT